MQEQTKISIILIISSFHYGLKNCLFSILTQSFSDFKLICVYDEQLKYNKLLSRISAMDDRVQIYSANNMAEYEVKNYFIQNARSEYILFLDDLVVLKENALRKLYEEAFSRNVDIVLSSAYFRTDSYSRQNKSWSGLIDKLWNMGNIQIPKDLQFDLNFHLYRVNFLVKNEIYFQNLKYDQSIIFLITAILFSSKISSIKSPMIIYRYLLNESNIFITKGIEDCISGIKYIIKKFPIQGLDDIWGGYISNTLSYPLKWHKRQELIKTFKNHLIFKDIVNLYNERPIVVLMIVNEINRLDTICNSLIHQTNQNYLWVVSSVLPETDVKIILDEYDFRIDKYIFGSSKESLINKILKYINNSQSRYFMVVTRCVFLPLDMIQEISQNENYAQRKNTCLKEEVEFYDKDFLSSEGFQKILNGIVDCK